MSVDPNKVIWKNIINDMIRFAVQRALTEAAQEAYAELLHDTLRDRGLCDCDLEPGQEPKTPVCDDCREVVHPLTSVLAPGSLLCFACARARQKREG